jgi:hypothetical protein
VQIGDLMRKLHEKANSKEMDQQYKMMEKLETNPTKKYQQTRKVIEGYIKSKTQWPEGLTHPENFRQFYWQNDFSKCGFAPSSKIATELD